MREYTASRLRITFRMYDFGILSIHEGEARRARSEQVSMRTLLHVLTPHPGPLPVEGRGSRDRKSR